MFDEMTYEEYREYLVHQYQLALDHLVDYGKQAFNEFDIVEPETKLEN